MLFCFVFKITKACSPSGLEGPVIIFFLETVVKCYHCLLLLFKKQASLTKFLKLKRKKREKSENVWACFFQLLPSLPLPPPPQRTPHQRTPHQLPLACSCFYPVLLAMELGVRVEIILPFLWCVLTLSTEQVRGSARRKPSFPFSLWLASFLPQPASKLTLFFCVS